jgi:predicted  nucleic acid-binding Zn-ribbon protein
MVTRAELLSAQSEIKACKEEAAAKAKELAWIESQVSKGQEQLQAARLEVAQLQATISAMVPRSEFEAAKKQFSEVEAAARLEEQVQRDLVRSLHDKLKALEDEKSLLRTKMQVLVMRKHSTFHYLISLRTGYVPQIRALCCKVCITFYHIMVASFADLRP